MAEASFDEGDQPVAVPGADDQQSDGVDVEVDRAAHAFFDHLLHAFEHLPPSDLLNVGEDRIGILRHVILDGARRVEMVFLVNETRDLQEARYEDHRSANGNLVRLIASLFLLAGTEEESGVCPFGERLRDRHVEIGGRMV